MNTILEKVDRLARVDTDEARTELYRIAGEQTRRADTVKARDKANERASINDANAITNAHKAGEQEKNRIAADKAGDVEAASVATAERDRFLTRSERCKADATIERARSAKLTASLTKLPKGSRKIRRAATRAARRALKRAKHLAAQKDRAES